MKQVYFFTGATPISMGLLFNLNVVACFSQHIFSESKRSSKSGPVISSNVPEWCYHGFESDIQPVSDSSFMSTVFMTLRVKEVGNMWKHCGR